MRQTKKTRNRICIAGRGVIRARNAAVKIIAYGNSRSIYGGVSFTSAQASAWVLSLFSHTNETIRYWKQN